MTEFLRNWILGILAAALFLGLLEAVMPRGPVRDVGKLATGLILFLAVVGPLLDGAPGWLRSEWEEQVQAVSAYPAELEETNESYLERIMSQRASEYIVAQAEALDLVVSAEVECVWSEGLPIPAKAEIHGEVPPERREALTQQIQSELGIDAQQIFYDLEAIP